MKNVSDVFLVTGATGMQGGETARALLGSGHRIRIMTRNVESSAARVLVKAGAEAVSGDMDDVASLDAAMRGVCGVFSVQVPDTTGKDTERRQGFALVQSAVRAGVSHFVHTSVAATQRHTLFPRWGAHYWWEKYWTDKWEVEEAARNAGFSSWTILRPAFMMGNYAVPKANFMFPALRHGEIVTALNPDTRLDLIAADDVGALARAAFENPVKFNRKNIDMAAQSSTMATVAATLSSVLAKKVVAISITPAEAVGRGIFPGWVKSQEWMNEVGYQVDIDSLKEYGMPLMTLEQWARKHRSDIAID